MKKRLSPVVTPTAFSIAGQFTGPPFSVMLESAELHRHLMEEIAHPGAEKPGKTKARRKTARAPAKRPNKRAKK